MNTIDILKTLTSSAGVTGDEYNDAGLNAEKILSQFGSVKQTKSGSLSLNIPGSGKKILLDAHLDRLGLIVTAIDKTGFLRVDKCGGIDRRVMAAARVTVLGKEKLKGVIISTPPHLAKSEDADKALTFESAGVDTGLSYEEISKIVKIGDRIIFDGEFTLLANGLIASPALDDRAGMTALIKVLDIISKNGGTDADITVLFSSQEEITGAGAKTGAYEFAPDEAIAVDVSFARAPGVKETESGELKKGAMICSSPSLDINFSNSLIMTAQKNSIPYQIEICPSSTGTNADDIALSRSGVSTAVVSIPQRNMHTQGEIIALEDIDSCAELIAQYILSHGGKK